jgi:hypothetical protein
MLKGAIATALLVCLTIAKPIYATEARVYFNNLEKCERFYIQKYLMDKGFYDNVIDGKWGRSTARALQEYVKQRPVSEALLTLVEKSNCAEITYYRITDEVALNAIINNRTVTYTKESTKDAGMVQKFYRNGKTSYANTNGFWKMMNGKYCSHYPKWNKDGEWSCTPVFVNRAGTMIRWDGGTNVWYGRIR